VNEQAVTTEEAIRLKVELTEQIQALLQEYSNKTGLAVTSIDVTVSTAKPYGGGQIPVYGWLSIEVKLPDVRP
jgi:hypothetical protein